MQPVADERDIRVPERQFGDLPRPARLSGLRKTPPAVSHEPHRPLDVLWQARTLIGVLMVVLGLALVLSMGREASRWLERVEQFGLFTLMGYWIVLLALGGLYLLRQRLAHQDPVRIAWVAAAMLLLATWATCFMVHWIGGGLFGALGLGELVARASVISITVGAISLGAFRALWGNLQLRSLARRSEIAALQARIRPHFLFNTLNAAVSLVRQKPEAVEAILLNLSDLFRAALAGPQVCSLAEEIELARKYLEIESMRFGSRLTVNWRLPEPLPEVDLPRLSLQPLVENAVLHGIERRPDGGRIDIEVGANGRELAITVRNDLPATDTPRRIGHHIGVEAVRERLLRVSGGRGRLDVRTEADRHVAQIVLPYATTS